MIWTVILRGKICNTLENLDSTQLQGWEFRILKNKKIRFSEIFFLNHKNRHISKTIRIWAVIIGGKIRNP